MAKKGFEIAKGLKGTMTDIRVEGFSVGIHAGDDVQLSADKLSIIDAEKGIVVGDRASLELKNTVIKLRSKIPSEIVAEIRREIQAGATNESLISRFAEKLKPWIDIADLASKGYGALHVLTTLVS